MKLSGLSIRVIGGGIGGLASALAFAKRGADVHVLEQAETVREYGAGLQISPNGMTVLRNLGVADALREVSPTCVAQVLKDGISGQDVLRMAIDDPQNYLFVHRADLVTVLAAAARAAGVKIRLLQRANKVVGGDVPHIDLANGDTCNADLVVGADGLHSVLRSSLNAASAPFFTGQVAWRAVVDNTIRQPAEARVHMGPGRHMVTYPLRGGRKLNIVAVEERQAWTQEGWSHYDDPANLKNAFSKFCPDVRQILENVEPPGLWGLFRHPVAAKWYGKGVALVGDAAHPTLPFMAQGANLALEDAWMLAQCLHVVEDRDMALAQYQALRRARAAKVVDAASRNAWKFHLRPKLFRKSAHAILGVTEWLAPGKMRAGFDWIYSYDVTKVDVTAPGSV